MPRVGHLGVKSLRSSSKCSALTNCFQVAPEGHGHGLEGEVSRQPRSLLLQLLDWRVVMADARCKLFVFWLRASRQRGRAEGEPETGYGTYGKRARTAHKERKSTRIGRQQQNIHLLCLHLLPKGAGSSSSMGKCGSNSRKQHTGGTFV